MDLFYSMVMEHGLLNRRKRANWHFLESLNLKLQKHGNNTVNRAKKTIPPIWRQGFESYLIRYIDAKIAYSAVGYFGLFSELQSQEELNANFCLSLR